MCAIAGILGGREPDQETISTMLKTMKRRGPDAHGIISPRGAVLMHSRLAVIDPEGGGQPMSLYWRGQHHHLVYNGELYNTPELRRELEGLGHHFLGHSDTEVLLHAYVQWGEDCLDRLNGIFAFAVWQEETETLFLARDRIGVKPLFYTQQENQFLFASEIKTILAHPSVPARMDANAVAEILLIGPGRTPGCGVFQGIREIEPGYCGTYQHGQLHLRRYWQLTDRMHTETLPQTLERIRYLVTDSIQRQLVSDVPVCTFLSGGLDSSLISAVAAKAFRDNGERLSTFSVDYEDNHLYFTPGKFQPNSDPSYIRMMTDALNSDHHWVILNQEELVDALPEAVEARDLPGMADVDASLLLLCRKMKEHATVALSGECADEIFGGYPWYTDPDIRSRSGFPWAQSTAWRASFLHKDYRNILDPEEYIHCRYVQTCRESHVLDGCHPDERRMKEMINLNFRWFMQTLLDRKDRMSMWSGLEVRVPFCDVRIAEYMYAVPWSMKHLDGYEKGLLRRAVGDLLPPEVLWRKKSPYPKTHNPAYLHLVSGKLRELIQDGTSPLFRIADIHALKELLTAQYPWPWYGQLMNTAQTIAYMLQVDHWLRHYKVELV
ncbi:MAG: asparagine synthase (glutamine-hydrolyzing) [Ruminococcaceae bacterium]|nr:asparagine synthase (glutamine-hydrolyzing) [Oscillospiraceae bacterium]